MSPLDHMGNIHRILHSSSLYTTPSASKGIARVFDLFGQLNTYTTHSTDAKADAHALARDWRIVGRDIANAIKTYGQKTSTKAGK
jgi:hypothetical protein